MGLRFKVQGLRITGVLVHGELVARLRALGTDAADERRRARQQPVDIVR